MNIRSAKSFYNLRIGDVKLKYRKQYRDFSWPQEKKRLMLLGFLRPIASVYPI